ncbi:3-hydroxylacyl-ACP dehydratase [Rhodoferax sp.]|uniref:3-hydroxylacyl-ACP dehydratase n=1 Tax=Rhodoferax sp. TaxID=50421 RepID=UPI0027789145|nr:3-hydroxylacyl-ACP dehydratase [Rhodoferax sp.]
MKRDHAWIAAHIPHQGTMCLLDSVERWSDDDITCRAVSHRCAANPLRIDGRLGIANGIEFAAQAMAVHGALLAANDGPPAVGFLTSVRDVQWQRTRLDDIDADLVVHARRIAGNSGSLLYQFELHADETVVLSGRASVMIKAPPA